MSSIPLPALAVQPPQSPLDSISKLMALKTMMGQQALQPGQQQLQQGAIQQQAIATQQAQLDLQDRQGMNQALKDSYGAQTGQKQTGNASAGPSTASGSATDRLSDFLNKIQDPKYGISASGQMAAMEKFTTLRQNLAKATSDQLDAAQKAHTQVAQGLNSVLEAAPEDQPAKWQLERNALARDPVLGQYAQQIPPQYPGNPQPGGSPEAQQMLHGLMLTQDVVSSVKEKAELPGQIANSIKAQQGVIPARGLMSPEAQQKVQQDIAVATNPQIQRGKEAVAAAEGAARANIETQQARGSNAALAQVPAHLVAPATAAATKAGEDYAQAQSVSQRLQAMMDAAKQGNVVSYQLIPQEGALQVTTSQGVHRINMAEIQNYGGGSLWQKLEGHIGGALTGAKIPDSVLNDMAQMQKIQAEGSQTKYENALKTVNQTYGSQFKPVEMAPMQRNQPPATHVPGGPAQGLKEGATGTGSDGKKYVVKGGVWQPQP
jgi:hypothetical protein